MYSSTVSTPSLQGPTRLCVLAGERKREASEAKYIKMANFSYFDSAFLLGVSQTIVPPDPVRNDLRSRFLGSALKSNPKQRQREPGCVHSGASTQLSEDQNAPRTEGVRGGPG